MCHELAVLDPIGNRSDCGCARLMAGFFAALLGAVRLLSIWCLSVGVEQGAFGRAVGEVRKSVVSELT